jgi:hypothetical protein
MEICIWMGNMSSPWNCCICGEPYEQGVAVASLVDGDNYPGDVCPDCLEAGHLVAAEKSREYSERLRTQAQRQEALALKLAAMSPDDWGTVDRLPQAEKDICRSFSV